ncbi:salicylate hydroxylase [Marasmius fiardii PR-910]|nr:salicylate hydroxylase [Marasmius fiardii PR-910]
MSSNIRLRVAICGGGIGGLTCALALSKYPDLEIDVYESASKLTEVGAGIGLFPRPWKIIRALGLEQDLLRVTELGVTDGPVTSFRYRKGDQPWESADFHQLVTNGSLVMLHRADYQQTLLRHLPRSCKTHCTKRLHSYSQKFSGPIELVFEDGSVAYCDVLLGADGLKSAVRKSMMGEKARWAQSEGQYKEATELLQAADPVWSGTNAYRALIPAERLHARHPSHRALTTPVQYLGKRGYVLAYPISQGKLVNFVGFTCRHDLENTKFNGPWVSVTDKSQFTPYFARWEPEVQAMLDCVEKPLQWAIHTVRPLRSFVSGRVALMGDAAHAMTPHQGSGAGQAIEDGYILATVLGHPRTNRDNLHRALRIYDEIRRPMAHRVMEKTRMNGRYYSLEFDGLDIEKLPPDQQWEFLQRLGKKFVKNWEWAWTTTVDDAVEEALRRLRHS